MTGGAEGIASVYSEELIALSEQAPARRLENPAIAGKAVSAVCGSAVTVECALDGEVIADIGFFIEGCALMRAVSAVMAKAAPGKTCAELAQAGRDLRDMLENGGAGPDGDWAQLRILMPVKDYPSRHDAVMLAFEAVEKALKGR